LLPSVDNNQPIPKYMHRFDIYQPNLDPSCMLDENHIQLS
jgi:hypothetical protein